MRPAFSPRLILKYFGQKNWRQDATKTAAGTDGGTFFEKIMKLFTVDEANELLPEIVLKLKEIKSRYALNALLNESVKAAATAAALGGGGLKSGSVYVQSLYEIGKLTTEINDLGVQLKDYKRSLIDFPTMRGGQLVLLCWQMGEDEKIGWWHEVEAGFAGRKPL
jgi:hypothetical protein